MRPMRARAPRPWSVAKGRGLRLTSRSLRAAGARSFIAISPDRAWQQYGPATVRSPPAQACGVAILPALCRTRMSFLDPSWLHLFAEPRFAWLVFATLLAGVVRGFSGF